MADFADTVCEIPKRQRANKVLAAEYRTILLTERLLVEAIESTKRKFQGRRPTPRVGKNSSVFGLVWDPKIVHRVRATVPIS